MVNKVSVGLVIVGAFLVASGGFGTSWQVMTAGGSAAIVGLSVLACKMNQEQKKDKHIPAKVIEHIKSSATLSDPTTYKEKQIIASVIEDSATNRATLNDPDTFTECRTIY